MTTAFWIASGEQFIHEADKSCASLRKHMPDVRCILFSPDLAIDATQFEEVAILPPRRSNLWYLDSVHYMQIALEHIDDSVAVYMDTDTYVCAPFYDFIQLAGAGFDLVGVHAPGRITTKTVQNIPDAFPEINVGVLAFLLNTERALYLVNRWVQWYEKYQDIYGNNDQGSLRDALWEIVTDPMIKAARLEMSQFRFYCAPQEYNCRLFGAFVKYNVKVLHGRAANIEQIALDINQEAGTMRVWKPG